MSNRLRLAIITLGGLIVLAIYTFPLWQSLVFVETASQDVPGLPESLQLPFRQLPASQQAAYRQMAAQDPDVAAQMIQAAIGPDRIVPEAAQQMPEMSNEVIAATGRLSPVDDLRQAAGNITVYRLPDNRRILRLEDFSVTNGPDLHIVLARSANPRTAAEIGNDYIDLGLLQGNIGSQNYAIPAEVDLEAYQSMAVYSVQFGVVFANAALTVR